ncbi:MAG: PRC-barrel domain-containing protein [Pseudomonadota bacterium]
MESDSSQHMSSKSAGAVYAEDVIGETVKHRESGEEIGSIQDLVIGEDGRIAGVVITTGAFLGLGGQEVGLSWSELERTMEDDQAVFYVDMDEEELRNAPEYERESE